MNGLAPAHAIAVDVVFSEATANDAALIEQTRLAGNVVHAFYFAPLPDGAFEFCCDDV